MIGGTGPPETARTKDSSWRWRRNRLIRRHVSNVVAVPQPSSELRRRYLPGEHRGVVTLAFAYTKEIDSEKFTRIAFKRGECSFGHQNGGPDLFKRRVALVKYDDVFWTRSKEKRSVALKRNQDGVTDP